jgi:sigma-B regulation protein RsbU (phosphoserine phosphatase)
MSTRTTTIFASEPIRLDPIAGPDADALRVEPGGVGTIGRSMNNDMVLLDGAVSREHASVQDKGGRWLLVDRGSRHGTLLNGVRLEAGEPAVIRGGDLVRIGPWTLRVRLASSPESTRRTGTGVSGTGTAMATVVASPGKGEVVHQVRDDEVGRLAKNRLDLLFEYAAQINAAPDEQRLCEAALQNAITGSGYSRGALLRGEGDGFEVIASVTKGSDAFTPASFDVSASLLSKASDGRPALLESMGGDMPDYGQSVMDLSIHSALCVPITVGEQIDSYLYLDARGRERTVQQDATGFCVALARICGLALSNLVRRDLEKRQAEMMVQLGAAREAQQVILPPEQGEIGGMTYALRMRPGMYVAGDMFDIIDVNAAERERGKVYGVRRVESDAERGDRVAVFLGDVTGEGIGAGILMASGQAHLHALLQQHADPEIAVNAVNKYLAEHSPPDRFISLWVGLFDRDARTLTYVDAGHGHWAVVRDGKATKEPVRGGIPAAIDPGVTYQARTIPFGGADRLVVFSDGVIEQSATGTTRAEDMFGLERVLEILGASASPAADVEGVMRAVLAHAGGDALDDDTTIASVQWTGMPGRTPTSGHPSGDEAGEGGGVSPGDRPIDPDGPTVT